MNSYSQAGQEQWVREKLKDKRNGYFIDLGAYDGVESSNTYYLEKELGWSGVCIESNSSFIPKLRESRSSIVANVAAMDYTGVCYYNHIVTSRNVPIGPRVRCDTLHNILIACSSPQDIDYMSMDIEGHELSVLQSFPFDIWNINLLTIEHNLYLVGPSLKDEIYKLMVSKGYTRDKENVCAPEGPYEDWYIKVA